MAKAEHIGWLLEGVEAWNTRREQHHFTPDFKDEDLCEIFRREGKLSDDGRIALAGINLANAELTDSRLSCRYTGIGPDLTGANLSWADFDNAQLPNAILDHANMHGTSFREAKLHNSSLLETRMAGTVLVGADLSHADLTDVPMNLMSLTGANLTSATLTGTDLTQANLVGADLSGSHPWKAKLYPEDRSPDSQIPNEDGAESVNTVEELVQRIGVVCQHYEECAVYFRGEPLHKWPLRPFVMRGSKKKGFPHRARESEMLIELMTRRPEDFADTGSALSQWVLAQHHGLPTRLLDITRNPLVALFWACQSKKRKTGRVHLFSVPKHLVKPFNSNTISVIASFAKLSSGDKNLLLGRTLEEAIERDPDSPLEYIYRHAMQRLYQLIRLEKPYFDERIDPRDLFRVVVVEPMQSFERIRAQAGAFLIAAFHERFERSKVLKRNPNIPIYHHHSYLIPSGSKQGILRELQLLNITRESLLPGLDETAKAVARPLV